MGSEATEFILLSSLGKYSSEELGCCETTSSTACCAKKSLGDSWQVTQMSAFIGNNVLSFHWALNLRICISFHGCTEPPDFIRIKCADGELAKKTKYCERLRQLMLDFEPLKRITLTLISLCFNPSDLYNASSSLQKNLL